MPRLMFTVGLISSTFVVGSMGCTGARHLAHHDAGPWQIENAADPQTTPAMAPQLVDEPTLPLEHELMQSVVQPVGFSETDPPTLRHALAAYSPQALQIGSDGADFVHPIAAEEDIVSLMDDTTFSGAENSNQSLNVIQLNLPSALAMVGGQHPAVGFAQWRVQEAYAQLARAESLWLPSVQSGFGFHRHDGNYQASNGEIVDVNRNSFQYGLGTGAVGAGTTMQPGLVAQFHLADAIFQPKVAEKTAWARGHAAAAVTNSQLLTAALAYLELLDAHQDARILEESQTRTFELAKVTSDFAEAGEGLQADADRVQTELTLVDSRVVGARERIAVASARLTQALSIQAGSQIMPMDVNAVPLEMVSLNADQGSLISTGLAMRPELKESQALVAAACEAYRREKYAPFVPSVLLGFSTGGFGGGLGNNLSNVESRYDFDALMTWELRNLGFGERAARRESSARIQQAKFEKLRMMDQVAREVSEAYSQVQFRRQQIELTQRAIASAQASFELNLARIRDGQGLPLEVLQSVQALEIAHRAYLRAVIDHNQAQFQLQWALGWSVTAPNASVTDVSATTPFIE